MPSLNITIKPHSWLAVGHWFYRSMLIMDNKNKLSKYIGVKLYPMNDLKSVYTSYDATLGINVLTKKFDGGIKNGKSSK